MLYEQSQIRDHHGMQFNHFYTENTIYIGFNLWMTKYARGIQLKIGSIKQLQWVNIINSNLEPLCAPTRLPDQNNFV